MTVVQDKQSILQDVLLMKKDLLNLRIKKSSGDSDSVKKIKVIKKKIARLFTKLNAQN
ncbi:MAG: ribosomal protein L29 [Lentimonas sp.]|jgi:ribosomal protein L29